MSAPTSAQESPAAAADRCQRRCLICGSARFARHFPKVVPPAAAPTPDQPYRITHSERRLVGAIERCADCGMVFLPLDVAATVSYSDAADPYYLEQAEERIANADALLDLVPPGGRLLEIGCACGFLLLAAQRRGFAAEGVEMSQWASGVARERYGLTVHTGRLEEAGLAADAFDVVVLADVIEHLTDPRATVREIRRITRPGGRVVVLTPDVGSLTARLAGPRWWGLLDDHYFYFSRPTIRRLFESEGFSIETLRAQGRGFPVSHWLFKLQPYSAVLHRLAERGAQMLRLADRRISINLGDQMACVARKN